MNEQILENLAIQATNGFGIDYNAEGEWKLSEREVKQLAELIVRECINQIHAADVGDLIGKSYYLDKVANHIENYFGVNYA